MANIDSSRQTLSVFAGNAINVSLYCFDPDTLGKYPVVRFLENCYIAFFSGIAHSSLWWEKMCGFALVS